MMVYAIHVGQRNFTAAALSSTLFFMHVCPGARPVLIMIWGLGRFDDLNIMDYCARLAGPRPRPSLDCSLVARVPQSPE